MADDNDITGTEPTERSEEQANAGGQTAGAGTHQEGTMADETKLETEAQAVDAQEEHSEQQDRTHRPSTI